MLKKIESLRKQPQHVRNRYAFWAAFFCTLVIAVVWGSTLPARFKTLEPETVQKPTPSEFTTFTSTVRELFSGAVKRFGAVSVERQEEVEDTKRIDLVEFVASTTPVVKPQEVAATTTATSSIATTSEAVLQASSTARSN